MFYVIMFILMLVTQMHGLHINNKMYQVHKFAKQNSSKNIETATIQAAKLYRNDQQIQQIISNLTLSHPQVIHKVNPYQYAQFTCQNDPNYNYIVIHQQQNHTQKKSSEKKKQVVITCNVHARELLTTEVCLEFITKLFKNQSEQQPIKQLLNMAKITIFYRGNDQRDNVIKGKDYCIRKDGNNIDINRNFPTNFNHNHTISSDQQYPGPQPLTQPFSICLDNYLKELNHTQKINLFIDIHTGEFTLFDSFESQNNATHPILEKVKQKYCPQCRITSLGTQKDDEVTNGQIFTDIKKRYKADHSVLLQIYGGYNDHLDNQKNCIAIFNPLTQKQLTYFKQLWTEALVYFINQTLSTSKHQSK